MRVSREKKPFTPICNACESPALLGGASRFHNGDAGIGKLETAPLALQQENRKARHVERAIKHLRGQTMANEVSEQTSAGYAFCEAYLFIVRLRGASGWMRDSF
jgi:hypothetical protein